MLGARSVAVKAFAGSIRQNKFGYTSVSATHSLC